ncbi:hypothetical protein Smp_013560 [Schistosoma mansoni]|uniref:hypothetical protein n=1 Tax=Schistosoma mansoni TaxID=6183 RepID=UPI0001A636E3|nr:hypothetical protein Smp_013560 [Schistosoma mansoni]|eukprot:XP_018644131.1 hypothetical protein Smp_013560 [Schistosoma mansoni]
MVDIFVIEHVVKYYRYLITHMAIHYYEKVLAMEPIGNNPEEKSVTNLHREAAFNLALLYRTNGNPAMARHILQKYVVI